MKEGSLSRAYKSVVLIVVVILGLVYAGDLIMPILFSGMIAILLNPLHDKLISLKLNNGLASFLVVLIISVLLITLLFVLAIQSQEIVQDLPKLMEQSDSIFDIDAMKNRSAYVYQYVQQHISTIEENIDGLKNAGLKLLRQGVIGVRDALLFLILCPIYVFFMLLCKNNIYRFIRSFHPKKENTKEDVIRRVKKSLFRYLRGLAIVMTISGTLTFIGLYFLGIEYALFLGVLTAVLTPIPYIGVFISAAIPVVLAILTKDNIWYPFGVLLIFGFVQFLEGYVFTPKIMGDSVNINPLMIVLGLIIFGSLTGIIGMIMTVPLLAISKVIIDHYPHLLAWRYLLEDEKSTSPKNNTN
jgi:predicted PurR-regulated permease PerM